MIENCKYCRLKTLKLFLKINVFVACIVICIISLYFLPKIRIHNPTDNENLKLFQSKKILTLKSSRYRRPDLTNDGLDMIGKFNISDENVRLIGDWRIPLFPHEIIDKSENIILNQMRFIPEKFIKSMSPIKKKTIAFTDLVYEIYAHNDNLESCPFKDCTFTVNPDDFTTADVIIYVLNINNLTHQRPSDQIWGYMVLESPKHRPLSECDKFEINWTITYRRDATIPFPYFIYLPYDLTKPEPERYPLPKKNFALGKTKMAAAFISNCNAANNRLELIEELKQYINVDVYGSCGTKFCPVSKSECFDMLKKHYKFYLAFENSNCRDYITEKLFFNGFNNDVIPIVMGAHPDDYKRVSPPHSFIHIEEFETIKGLANYMIYLAKNDTAYNEYFGWRDYGLISNTSLVFCRICMMAHQAEVSEPIITDLLQWQQNGIWNATTKRHEGDSCIVEERWLKS